MGQREYRRRGDAGDSVGEFMRAHKHAVLVEWERVVRVLPVASRMSSPLLLDHIPDVFDRIARIVDALDSGDTPIALWDLAELHAVDRLGEGFDLSHVVAELAMLRDCIIDAMMQQPIGATVTVEIRLVNQAIDIAVRASVVRFTQARDRTLLALDQIATQAFESRSLDDLLHRLLAVFASTTASVDTAVILIRDGDALRVRATFGLDMAEDVGRTFRIGEGLAGRIAATGQAVTVGSSTDPVIASEALRRSGVRAIYGVPLLDGADVIGVAHMGSLTTSEFSAQDKALLSVMANRAAAAIFQQLLRERADQASHLLEQAVRARDEILAVVSHDLRGPLGAIDLGATMALATDALGPTARKHLERIRRSATRMERLLRDLLDTASLQVGRLSLERRPESLAGLVADVADCYDTIAAGKQIQIVSNGDVDGISLEVDRERVLQALGNILGNAVKFCRPHDVITIRVSADDRFARIAISDTGPGIADSDLGEIFRPYWSAQRDARNGTGLGLYICRGIVEAHGGQVTVESSLGVGTTILASFPIDTTSAPGITPA